MPGDAVVRPFLPPIDARRCLVQPGSEDHVKIAAAIDGRQCVGDSGWTNGACSAVQTPQKAAALMANHPDFPDRCRQKTDFPRPLSPVN